MTQARQRKSNQPKGHPQKFHGHLENGVLESPLKSQSISFWDMPWKVSIRICGYSYSSYTSLVHWCLSLKKICIGNCAFISSCLSETKICQSSSESLYMDVTFLFFWHILADKKLHSTEKTGKMYQKNRGTNNRGKMTSKILCKIENSA